MLTENMREGLSPLKPNEIGPFVTISREYGCHGFSLGLLLLEILTEESDQPWQIYHKDILSRLATETNIAQEMLERERSTRPSLIVDFFRSFSKDRIPSGFEIRNRITTIIRCMAIEGRAIIIGQGGAAATQDLPNGISVRLEAPEEWRINQVAFQEGLEPTQAKQRLQEVEAERECLRRIYQLKFPRKPAFNLVYDCSVFSLAQIAQHIAYMMKLRKLVTS